MELLKLLTWKILRGITDTSCLFSQVSLRSDCSSDSESYVILGGETGGLDKTFDASDLMFRVSSYPDNNMQKVEMASEFLEEEPTGTIVTTPSERADSIDSSIKRRDLVYLTFSIIKISLPSFCFGEPYLIMKCVY